MRSADIIIHPRSTESAGEMCQRWTARGYALSNKGNYVVARPIVPVLRNVVEMPRSNVDAILEWLSAEEMR